MANLQDVLPLLCCPRCRAPLQGGDRWACQSVDCSCSRDAFPTIRDKPVLIDFETSVFDRAAMFAASGDSPISRKMGLVRSLRERLTSENGEAESNCRSFLANLRGGARPKVLIIGGGARGAGTEALYAAAIDRIATDVYDSPIVDLLADGHRLPFKDDVFDGVWIQAVLEHVASPHEVVAEIDRVLKDGGIVYAETPFLQPVHERAYDFSRFTPSGHRWLFRRFEEVGAGPIGGPAQALLWSIRYLFRSLLRSDKAGTLAAIAFSWVRLLDRLVDQPYRSDAATGVFFLGRKSSASGSLSAKDLIRYFPGVRGG